MTVRVGINGFGRIGRLALRAALRGNAHPLAAKLPDLNAFEFVHINEIKGGAETAAHLLAFDSVHGQWPIDIHGEGDRLSIGAASLGVSHNPSPSDTPWGDLGVDIVIEASGKFTTRQALAAYADTGVKKVIVAAPVKDADLNIVIGVNDHLYDPERHHLVTAASCTTNCLAPVVKVVHDAIGIRHGLITTIHDVTNTQTMVDAPHRDLRRARSGLMSIIPTTTGSASAIGMIYPELAGKLSGIATRIPLLNASLTDCVFEMSRSITVREINDLLQSAASGPLQSILGFETRPLVSVDYVNDPRSSIVDASSTMVIGETMVKILAWYDNEMAYSHRLAELTQRVAATLPSGRGFADQSSAR